jgi:hypothetical protein
MWTELKTLINFDTFCQGCALYIQHLATVDLAATLLSADEITPEPVLSYLNDADIYALKASRNMLRFSISNPPIEKVYRWN